jgi:hypothetical protein
LRNEFSNLVEQKPVWTSLPAHLAGKLTGFLPKKSKLKNSFFTKKMEGKKIERQSQKIGRQTCTQKNEKNSFLSFFSFLHFFAVAIKINK